MGTWQEDTAPLRFKRADAMGVQVRPVTISQNKPNLSHYKALCARRLFVQRPHIVPILVRQRLNCRGTESHQGHHGYVWILDNTQI